MSEQVESGEGDRHRQEFLLITGMSGAGKGTAAKVLEELGWYVVDNIPVDLIGRLLERAAERAAELPRFAVVADVRSLKFQEKFDTELAALVAKDDMRVLFLDATDEELVKRYNHVRRSHPLQRGDGLVDGIERERELLEGLRGGADVVVDTTALTVHDLRRRLENPFGDAGHAFQFMVESFGFKYGVPTDIDMLYDMRFLPNPHWVPELKPLTGKTKEVSDYVLAAPEVAEYLDAAETMIGLAINGFRHEGKRYLTVAVGCTGGKHRSVAVAEEIARRVESLDAVDVTILHRDLGRE